MLVRCLAALPEDTLVLLRRGISTPPGQFERDVESLCSILHLAWEWCLPEPTDETPGRASVYVRDIAMLDRADLALLFFTPDDVEAGTSGTSHLQDQALQLGRPCYAYSVAPDGAVALVGDYDPDHLYAELVPAAG